ncbi:hypothetical protein AQUCO_02900049v1 [Aquilegia coerulea]|uniref:Pentacotripeptide-repeat region of PRORP domain-containing protein n=1 Tax=Aquilegia coerulea TaxID=218851 RepID=A0A2G5D331_AQUCA|nr:hypothetical protein AQUCO_02900049v1 [Aquilegia coerulea]
MKESGFKPTEFTHNCIYGCLCTRENISAVLDLLREMDVCGHESIKHDSGLVKQLCCQGKAVEACGLLADMGQESFLPDIITYSAATDGLFEIQEVDRALELFQDISTCGNGPDVVVYNIRVLDARKLLNEMLEKGLLPSVVTCNSMIEGLCKGNELDQAFHDFKEMISEGREPTIIRFRTLVDGLCALHKLSENSTTSLDVRNLISEGCIPAICSISEEGDREG